jgi:hypothetical protein
LLVQRERQRVLVEIPVDADAAGIQQAHDIVRDAAATSDVGLLRLERRRGHLQDLFAGASA